MHAGVIKDEDVHHRVLEKTVNEAQEMGFWPVCLVPSPIQGPKGNIEFLIDLRLQKPTQHVNIQKMIARALDAVDDTND